MATYRRFMLQESIGRSRHSRSDLEYVMSTTCGHRESTWYKMWTLSSAPSSPTSRLERPSAGHRATKRHLCQRFGLYGMMRLHPLAVLSCREPRDEAGSKSWMPLRPLEQPAEPAPKHLRHQ
jgi:hypothetical protein